MKNSILDAISSELEADNVQVISDRKILLKNIEQVNLTEPFNKLGEINMAQNIKIDQKVEKIRTLLKKNRPKIHPLKEHPIIQYEEYLQKLYIDHLCVIAQYENEDIENQFVFIERIMIGAGLQGALSECLKNAMELTAERFAEFLHQCQEKQLQFIFLLDSMLIACANGTPNAKQISFLAELAEALGITKQQMRWISLLTKAILEQDNHQYQTVCTMMPNKEKDDILPKILCYLKEFVTGVLLDTDDIIYLYAKEKTVFDLAEYCGRNEKDLLKTLTRKKFIVENLLIENSRERKYWHCFYLSLKSCDEVILRNCEFSGWMFQFTAIKKILFENCKISYDKATFQSVEGILYLHSINNINFQNCQIKDICLDEGSRSSVIRVEKDTCTIELDNCKFMDIESLRKFCADPILLIGEDGWIGSEIHIINGDFKNCCSNGSYLFGPYIELTVDDKTKFIGCSKLQ